MANAYQVKMDVVNELRNKIYYNQLEVQRQLNNTGASHKDVVDQIVYLLERNVIAQQSIDLLEAYVPAQPQVTQPQPPAQATADDGVRKID